MTAGFCYQKQWMNLSHSVRQLNLMQSFENVKPSLPLSSEAVEESDSLEAVETCFRENISDTQGTATLLVQSCLNQASQCKDL